MNQARISFQFAGPHARTDAEALAAVLRAEFPEWSADVVEQRPASSGGPATRSGEAIAIVALILSLPGVAKNAIDLADRLKLAAGTKRLIAWARERHGRRQQIPVVVLPPNNRLVPLHEATPEQILDALAGRTGVPPVSGSL